MKPLSKTRLTSLRQIYNYSPHLIYRHSLNSSWIIMNTLVETGDWSYFIKNVDDFIDKYLNAYFVKPMSDSLTSIHNECKLYSEIINEEYIIKIKINKLKKNLKLYKKI